MEKEVIPERAITIGCNEPTKWNVTPKGMMRDIKQNLWQKFYQREERTCGIPQ